jgi:hypothetical protein
MKSNSKIIKQTINSVLEGKILNEGVSYNEIEDKFTFDFYNDGKVDIISLTKHGYQVQAFNHCYHYGYEFEPNIDSTLRTKFIKSIKFPDGKISEKDKKTFIINAVNQLDNNISIPSFNLIIYPESISELNRDMLKYLNRLTQPHLVSMEMIKQLPQSIEFDYNKFKLEILDSKLENGKPRYSEAQKKDVLFKISTMMDNIRTKDYFSIARHINKAKYRPYIKNYYTFKIEEDKILFKSLEHNNILIIDDIVTSGTTLTHLLTTLRTINDTNNIVIFSLIGKDV